MHIALSRAFATATFVSCSVSAFAAVPTYEAPRIYARGAAVGPGFELPKASTFSRSGLAIASDGRVAASLLSLDGESVAGIWVGTKAGRKVLVKGDESTLFTDLSFAKDGSLLYHALSAGGFTEALRRLAAEAKEPETVFTPKALKTPTQYTSDAVLLNSGWIGFKHTDEEGNRSLCRFKTGEKLHCFARDVEADAKSPFSFLFTTAIAKNGSFASKVRLGKSGQLDEKQPDRVLLWTEEKITVVAVDSDDDAASQFAAFDNSVAVNTAGQVAFLATKADKTRGLFRKDGEKFTEIATAGEKLPLADLGSFAMNESGVLTFLALTKDGLQRILVADGGPSTALTTLGDTIKSDRGDAMLAGFQPKLAINDRGEVACLVELTKPKTNLPLGEALVVIAAQEKAPKR